MLSCCLDGSICSWPVSFNYGSSMQKKLTDFFYSKRLFSLHNKPIEKSKFFNWVEFLIVIFLNDLMDICWNKNNQAVIPIFSPLFLTLILSVRDVRTHSPFFLTDRFSSPASPDWPIILHLPINGLIEIQRLVFNLQSDAAVMHHYCRLNTPHPTHPITRSRFSLTYVE